MSRASTESHQKGGSRGGRGRGSGVGVGAEVGVGCLLDSLVSLFLCFFSVISVRISSCLHFTAGSPFFFSSFLFPSCI